MADPQDRREEGAEAAAPVRKAAAKKAPAKKTPPRQPAPPVAAAPALNPAPNRAALTAVTREAAATPRPPQESFGRGHPIPLSLGLAAVGLVAIGLSRLRRG